MAASERVKDKKDNGRVEPGDVYNYLTKDKGISHTHALGIMANINTESSWNPSVSGDSGNAIGLFQHNGPRKTALLKYVNGDTTNWKKQIDFALTEQGTSKYLNKSFTTPEAATEDFMVNWERPADKSRKAISGRQQFLTTFGNGIYATPNYQVQNNGGDISSDQSIPYSSAPQFLTSSPSNYSQQANNFKTDIAVEKEKIKKTESDPATKELTAVEKEHNARINFLNMYNIKEEPTAENPLVNTSAEPIEKDPSLYRQDIPFELADQTTPLFKTSLGLPESSMPVQEFRDGGDFEFGDGERTQSLADLTIGDEYHYAGRPEKSYKINDNGEWLIRNSGSKDNWKPLKDPTGERAATLERTVMPKSEYLEQRRMAIQKELGTIKGQGNKFYLPDTRTMRATTGQAIRPNVDLMGGDYSEDVVKEIIIKARAKGVDPKTALAIALQESQLGKKDTNLGHSLVGGEDPYSYMDILKSKVGLAKTKGHEDEETQLQFYNGTGKLFPGTEAKYHGFQSGKFYGVPVTAAGLDMLENPLYGKQIIDLRDNVIGKSKHIDSLLNVKSFAEGGITGEDGPEVYTYSGRPGSTYQKDANNNWLIQNKDTNGKYVPLKDPTGSRAKTLNAQAKPVYTPSYSSSYNPKFDQASESTNVNNNFAKSAIPTGKFNLLEEGYKKTVNQQQRAANKVKSFMEGYQNSPRYEEMLKQSEPDNWQDWQDARQMNLFGYEDTFGNRLKRAFVPGAKNYRDHINAPNVTIAREQGDEGNTGGFSQSDSGNITVLPRGYEVKGLLPHETSHTEDRPLQSRINLRTGLPYPDNMMNSQGDQRLIPAKDQAYIFKIQPKNWSDSPEYKELSPGQKETVKHDPDLYKRKEKFMKYVGDPTETRARLNDIRYQSKQRGLYDPYEEKVTPKTYKKLLETKFEKDKDEGFDALKQLKGVYSDKQIQWMLNNISQNQEQQDSDMTQGYGRYGGVFENSFANGGILDSLLDQNNINEFKQKYGL